MPYTEHQNMCRPIYLSSESGRVLYIDMEWAPEFSPHPACRQNLHILSKNKLIISSIYRRNHIFRYQKLN